MPVIYHPLVSTPDYPAERWGWPQFHDDLVFTHDFKVIPSYNLPGPHDVIITKLVTALSASAYSWEIERKFWFSAVYLVITNNHNLFSIEFLFASEWESYSFIVRMNNVLSSHGPFACISDVAAAIIGIQEQLMPENADITRTKLGRVDGFNQHQPARKTDDG